VSPRNYNLGMRKAAVEQTRANIIEATRSLLATSARYADVSLPAVARQADVSRDTVYRQFGSRSGLLEAVFDDGAARGGLHQIRTAFVQPSALEGIGRLIEVFCGFWASDTTAGRRLRSLAALDVELDKALAARDDRRRDALRVLLRRLRDETDPCPAALSDERLDDSVDLLHALTSFQTYDQLSAARQPADVASVLIGAAHVLLGVELGRTSGPGKTSGPAETSRPVARRGPPNAETSGAEEVPA
jgi:AcrR family transcriptional regulator